MGGVVSDVVSGVGDLGQGIISGVDDALTGIDDALPEEAKIAAAIYLASQGIPTGAEGGILSGANAAVAADNAYLASQAAGAGMGAGASAALAADNAYLASQALTPAQAAQAAASSIEASQVGGLANSALGTQIGSGTSLLGGAVDWAKANPLQAAGLGLTAAKALGGSTPSSSTTTSSIDPDVKAAYLQNLADARATAAGLGQRQFAPMSEYNLGMVQRYMNPYEQEVIQGSLGDIERARQMQRAQENVQATAARAFGGSRQGVTRSLVDEAALRDVANLTSRLRSQGFTQAQNLGLAQEDLRRQLEQQRLDAARGLGVERLGVSQAALSLQPARIGESTTSPIFRNPAASGLGGALAGGQLGSLIGGKQFGTEYAGYGAGIGGLLGLLG